ncbi:GNAT family N-acetyltransferase [Alkaliphilus peptidifermentans]|uniref:Acetyltransferase (GNAT) domain-containing protein n=1 Tax=Alkaliphilus peptidifermentans DSM 18978 TaxID=1120976 RepID=A0A1G5GZ53_9FIRM|nr:GNAT family N-acetyltransferase [Alkaliphilus peptidifermentans]SCY56677.1 Acetyltransferase (GNAT) domain-containing protein [Alkaliphilus peptidifermentans DSM 18978]
MREYTLISDYMNIDKYRKSFNKLAMDTFGLDFEDWYHRGLFYNKYMCYSYINEDEVIANVSINKMDLIVEGQNKKAIQIGTVMTHPDYRNKGLSASLMKYIIEKYEKNYDVIYLFANKEVLNFYPKFGFDKVIEAAYQLDVDQLQKKETLIKKLDKDNEEDRKTIERLGSNRLPISKRLGVYNDIWPLFVYCLYEYRNDLYYLVNEDVILIMRREDKKLNIYDILSLKPIDLDSIVEKVVIPDDRIVEFHFVPEFSRYKSSEALKERPDDTLFVISKNTSLKEILFPMPSRT